MFTEIFSRRSPSGRGLGPGFHEGANEAREFFARHTWVKADAGDAGGVEQVGEAAFGGA